MWVAHLYLLRNPGIILPTVHKRNITSSERRKVEDNLVALAHCKDQILRANNILKQPDIRRNDIKSNRLVVSVLDKRKHVGTTERHLVKPKSVLAGLDIEVWPGLSVHLNDVAEEVQEVSLKGGEITVGLVCCVRDCEWDVVWFVWESNFIFPWLVNEIDACLALH